MFIADESKYINPTIIPTSVLLSDKSRDLNLDSKKLRYIQNCVSKSVDEQMEDRNIVWGGSTFPDDNIIVINDNLRYFDEDLEREIKGTETHEKTHLVLHNKYGGILGMINKEFEEGVAFARESFVFRDSGKEAEKMHEIHKPSYMGYNHKKIAESFHTYIEAAEELGDDIALNLARDAVKLDTLISPASALKKFKESVSNYKLNLLRIFE